MRLNLLAGLMVGLFAGSLFFGLHAMGELRTPQGAQALWTVVAFHAVTLVVVLRRHRGREPEIPFARLLAAGMAVTLVAALVSTAFTAYFLERVDPDFLGWLQEQSLAQLESYELEPAEKELQIQAIRAGTPSSFLVQGLIAFLVRGFLLTLPIAALLRLRTVRTGE